MISCKTKIANSVMDNHDNQLIIQSCMSLFVPLIVGQKRDIWISNLVFLTTLSYFRPQAEQSVDKTINEWTKKNLIIN